MTSDSSDSSDSSNSHKIQGPLGDQEIEQLLPLLRRTLMAFKDKFNQRTCHFQQNPDKPIVWKPEPNWPNTSQWRHQSAVWWNVPCRNFPITSWRHC